MLETKHFYEFGPFRLDPAERLLLRNNQRVPLAPKAFEALVLLVENSGRLLTKDELMKRLWRGTFVEEANLAQNVSAIRRALEDKNGGPQYIETVAKGGYRFIGEARRVAAEAPPMAPTVEVKERAADVAQAEERRKRPVTRMAVAAAAVLAIRGGFFSWRSGPFPATENRTGGSGQN